MTSKSSVQESLEIKWPERETDYSTAHIEEEYNTANLEFPRLYLSPLKKVALYLLKQEHYFICLTRYVTSCSIAYRINRSGKRISQKRFA
jgi:hypothetical protein